MRTKAASRLLAIMVPVMALGACTTLSAEDRALLDTAKQQSSQALGLAQQALDTAKTAQATADQASKTALQAAQNAQAAAASAQAANEKADRMFQRSLHK